MVQIRTIISVFVQLELDNKEDELKTLQEKMTQLQELIKTQHIHTELQVFISSGCDMFHHLL